jgi:hypothetical protein
MTIVRFPPQRADIRSSVWVKAIPLNQLQACNSEVRCLTGIDINAVPHRIRLVHKSEQMGQVQKVSAVSHSERYQNVGLRLIEDLLVNPTIHRVFPDHPPQPPLSADGRTRLVTLDARTFGDIRTIRELSNRALVSRASCRWAFCWM